MSKKPKLSKSIEEAAGPLAMWRAYVQALAQLRDEGEYMIFLPPQGSFRFIGDRAQLDKYAAKIDPEVSGYPEEKAKELVYDIRNFLTALVLTGDEQKATKHLSRMIEFDNEDTDPGDAPEPFSPEVVRTAIKERVEVVSSKLLTGDFSRRRDRLRTATNNVLQEIDAEVVSSRSDFGSHTDVTDPFLRVRIRYSLSSEPGFPFRAFGAFHDHPIGGKAFELECDTADIDLMIRRLTQAKDMLIDQLSKDSVAK